VKCRECGGRTRVVHVTHRLDGTHRWLRCLVCKEPTRTIETYAVPRPGPPRGSSKDGEAVRGSKNGASVLLEGDVIRLRDMWAAGTSQVELARIFGVSTTVVSRIVRRLMWKHV
jgi:hypothetical protein